MLLTFSKTEFRDRIRQGIKIHTIRQDKHNRWKEGMNIHFWLGNPRNTRSKTKPYQFGKGVVSIIRWITIDPFKNEIRIDGDLLSPTEMNMCAKCDGFDSWQEMKKWFSEPFIGRIIYWENFELTANDDGITVF